MALALGFVGVLGFSGSLPATRVAVAELDPVVVGLGRAFVAAFIAAVILRALRAPRPTRAQLRRLAVVALGVVFGFPYLMTLGMEQVNSSEGSVVVGLLPAATAVMAVLRAGERPSPAFWGGAAAGLVAVLVFAASEGAGLPRAGDLILLAAVGLASLAYAEGGALAREMGGPQVICWALVVSLPLLAPPVIAAAALDGLQASGDAWVGFAYVTLISMLFAFFPWYAGLARGGVAKIGQVQLLQGLLTLVWAALLLGEHVGPATIAASIVVLASVAVTQRAQVARPPVASLAQ